MRGIVWRRATIGIGAAALALGASIVPSAAQHTESATPAAAGVNALVVVDGRVVPPGRPFIPPRLGSGDADYSGNGPNVTGAAILDGAFFGSRSLTARVCLSAKETKSDFTEAAGCSVPTLIYQTPTDFCIQTVDRGNFDALHYVDTDHALDTAGPQVTNTFVNRWEVTGDSSGDDAGLRTGVQIHTRSLVVNIAPC